MIRAPLLRRTVQHIRTMHPNHSITDIDAEVKTNWLAADQRLSFRAALVDRPTLEYDRHDDVPH
jgi:hypothetical protein